MKKLIFCVSLLIFSFGSKAQFYLSSGETITVPTSNDFFLQEDLINGGTITNLTINGSNALNISGTGTINNLIVNNNKKPQNCNALILGVTFKENCSDIRNSRVFSLHKSLIKLKISYADSIACEAP